MSGNGNRPGKGAAHSVGEFPENATEATPPPDRTQGHSRPWGRAMNALVRKPVVVGEACADPVEVFRLRCASRAKLWHTGQIDLHNAVDELQHSAEASGLIDPIGQNAVQGLMVEAFAPLRDDLLKFEDIEPEPTFAKLCREADEKQRRKLPDPRLERLRRLMDNDVSIERAWHKIDPNDRAAESTVEALMFSLRRGINELTQPSTLRRLSTLDEYQLEDVCLCVQAFQQRIAPAWSAADVDLLISAWRKFREPR